VELFLELIDKLSEEDLDALQQDIASKLMAKDKKHVETGIFDLNISLPVFADLEIQDNKLDREEPSEIYHSLVQNLELILASQIKIIEETNKVGLNAVTGSSNRNIFTDSVKSNQKSHQAFVPTESNIQLCATNH
jgi:hypothetical protein